MRCSKSLSDGANTPSSTSPARLAVLLVKCTINPVCQLNHPVKVRSTLFRYAISNSGEVFIPVRWKSDGALRSSFSHCSLTALSLSALSSRFFCFVTRQTARLALDLNGVVALVVPTAVHRLPPSQMRRESCNLKHRNHITTHFAA